MPTDVCPARATAAMLLQMKITTSCPNNAKPHVVRSPFFAVNLYRLVTVVVLQLNSLLKCKPKTKVQT